MLLINLQIPSGGVNYTTNMEDTLQYLPKLQICYFQQAISLQGICPTEILTRMIFEECLGGSASQAQDDNGGLSDLRALPG